MIGCPNIADLSPEFLATPGTAPPERAAPFRPQEVISR